MNNEKLSNMADRYEAYCEGGLLIPIRLCWLLEHHPVHWSEQMQSWFVVRYADVTQVLSDRACPRIAPCQHEQAPSEMQRRCVSSR